MADYTTVAQVKAMAGGVWTPDTAVGFGETRDQILAGLITTTSRLFDRECGKPTNWWSTVPGTTRAYSGDGSTRLYVDEWDAITAVTMSTTQDRSDAITLHLVPAAPGDADFVGFDPVNGPPFNSMFLLRGFFPDVYDVGNVHVTGTPTLPVEIAEAVAIWVAYRYKMRDAGWAEVAPGSLGGAAVHVANTVRPEVYIPPDTMRVINFFKEYSGPQADLVSGQAGPVTSPWLGWGTVDLGPGHGP